MRAPLIEIFSSVQGEGRYAGTPMTFVRVAVCPIRCVYCDTPNSYAAPGSFPVRIGDLAQAVKNPVAAEQVAGLAADSATASPYGRTSWVSITGGEPLLYPGFVRELGSMLRARGLRVFLETAALSATALDECVSAIDHLSLDYKLPGTLAEGDAVAAGEQCVASVELAVAQRSGAPSVDVKLVLTAEVTDEGVRAALSRLAPFRARIRLVLQPVTPFGAVRAGCPPEKIARFAALAVDAGFEPFVLPQIHKLLGID